MADWYVNCVAAQLLHEDHGYALGIFRESWPGSLRLQGRYYVDFERNRLIVHDSWQRVPLINLGVGHVLEMTLLPNEECREAYLQAIKEEQRVEVSHRHSYSIPRSS